MARDQAIERRLRDWAQWMKVGDGSGYATRCTIHPEWSPPTSGMTPTMKVGAHSTAKQTHRAIATLSERLQNTLVLHYVTNLSVADQAARLQCTVETVGQRVCTAHRRLLAALSEN